MIGNGAPRAIVLGLTPHPRSVATLRSLGRAGIEIFGLDHERPPHRGYSRYLKGNYRIEPSPDQVLQALLDMDPADGGILIPTSDLYMLLLSRNHERLSRSIRCRCRPGRTCASSST